MQLIRPSAKFCSVQKLDIDRIYAKPILTSATMPVLPTILLSKTWIDAQELYHQDGAVSEVPLCSGTLVWRIVTPRGGLSGLANASASLVNMGRRTPNRSDAGYL